MDAHAQKVLEYSRVRDLVAARAVSASGREAALALEPTADAIRLRSLLRQTDEARALLDRGEPLPIVNVDDIGKTAAAGIETNRPLEPGELSKISDALDSARRLGAFVRERRAALVELWRLAESFADHDLLRAAIEKAIEAPGAIKDSASERLWDLRRTVRRLEDEIRERIQGIMDHPKVRDALQSPTVSLRNGRFVLPVKIDMKGLVPGMLHDLSQSGQTAFIEPSEIVPMTNKLREWKLEVTKEERRILWELTKLVIAQIGTLRDTSATLAWFDVTAARGRLSKDFGMTSPAVSADGRLRLVEARHPLLIAAKDGAAPSAVVPLDVRLREGFRILVVTGPNTGGKTVALKTIGILQLMFQTGLHIPAGQGSVMPVASGVFADIGDEQSIDQSLSTFSGHIRNITEILRHADARSLVLLDELGSGTEPSEGAALGTAILDRLLETGCAVVVTTHLGSLKEYALAHAEVENACVEFDAENMRPTYRLLVGQPGNSNALLIAERYGLDPAIVEAARRRVDPTAKAGAELVDRLLESRVALEKTRQESETQLQKSKNLAKAAEERIRHVEKRELRVEREADEVIDETLKGLNAELDQPLRELGNVPKQWKAAVDAVRAALRRAVRDSSLGKKRREHIETLKKDDQVFVPRFGAFCRIAKFHRDEERLTVLVGKLPTEIGYDEISWLDPSMVRK